MAAPSGLSGDNPFAISSALTNSFTKRVFGNIVIEAVVFPAPLHPAMIYSFGSLDIIKSILLIIPISLHQLRIELSHCR